MPVVTAPNAPYDRPGTPGLPGAAAVVDALGTAVALVVEPGSESRIRAQWARCLTNADPVQTLDLRGQSDPDVVDYIAASQATLLGLVGQLGGQGDAGQGDAGQGDAGSGVQRVNLHAAGLSDRSGSVLALVGASGSGKTTAAAVLGQDLGYVTDECVSVEPGTLEVLAYPKPLSVVIDPADPHHKTQRGPGELGLQRPPEGLRLCGVVLLRRSREPIVPMLTPMSVAEALMALLPQVSGLARMREPLQTVADLLIGTGGAVWLDYQDIGEAAPLLTGLLAGPGRARRAKEPAARPPARASEGPPAPGEPHPRSTRMPHDGSLLRRASWIDVVDSDEQLVVFDGQRPFLLAGVGRLAWLLLEDPQPVAALHQRLTGLLGPHPASLALVRDAIALLVDAGLIEPAAGFGSE